MSVLRARLRSETADAHTKLERALDLLSRLRDRGEALLILVRLYGLFAGIEPGLERILGRDSMDGHRRVEDLRQDLMALRMETNEIARLAILTWEPPMAVDEAIGALYVLEGMRLGGRIVGRAIAVETWLPRNGLRFWAAENYTGAPWASILQRLDDVNKPDLAVRGATRMFDTCLRWLAPEH